MLSVNKHLSPHTLRLGFEGLFCFATKIYKDFRNGEKLMIKTFNGHNKMLPFLRV